MADMLIGYYTRTGHTAHMAEAIADGAREVDGVTVTVKPLAEIDCKDLPRYDAIILGSPTYYGSMSWEVKKLIDDSVTLHGQLVGKVGGAFSSSANIGGGNETAIMDILKCLLVHGMVVAGIHKGDHYGPVAIGDVDDRARKQCTRYGRTAAELAVKLKA